MRLSRWVVFVPFGDDETIAFSTLTGGTALLPNSLVTDIKNGKVTDCSATSALLSTNILINDDVDDLSLFNFRLWKTKSDTSYLLATILPTYRCNFGCVYCLQRGSVPEDYPVMSPETAAATADWVAKMASLRHYHHVELAWFGGEPLLAVDRILEMTARVKRSLPEKVSLSHFFQTNGFLLKDALPRLSDLKNVFFQVSLDGPRDIHDARRPLRDGAGTFDRVMKGIEAALTQHQVGLIINLDNHNVARVQESLRTLAELRPSENLRVWFGFISRPIEGSQHCNSHCWTTEQICEDYVDTMRIAREVGLHVTNNISMGLCYQESFSTPIIDPVGDIYSCLSAVGRPDHLVGSVHVPDPMVYIARKSKLVARHVAKEECDQCPYLPLCRGGCRYQALVNLGSTDACLCKRSLAERVYSDIIALRVSCGQRPTSAKSAPISAEGS